MTTPTLTPELLADLRKKAEAFEGTATMRTLVEYLLAANPAVVLALLNRLSDYQTALEDIAGMNNEKAERNAADVARDVLIDHGAWKGTR